MFATMVFAPLSLAMKRKNGGFKKLLNIVVKPAALKNARQATTIERVLVNDAKMVTTMAAFANILNTKAKCEKDSRHTLIWKNAKHNLKEYDYEPS
jgi:hypothetical protein